MLKRQYVQTVPKNVVQELVKDFKKTDYKIQARSRLPEFIDSYLGWLRDKGESDEGIDAGLFIVEGISRVQEIPSIEDSVKSELVNEIENTPNWPKYLDGLLEKYLNENEELLVEAMIILCKSRDFGAPLSTYRLLEKQFEKQTRRIN